MPQRAAAGKVLIPAQQLVHRDHDRTAPAGIRRVHRAILIGRTLVREQQFIAFLAQADHHPVGAPIAGAAGFDVRAVLPVAVRNFRHLLEKGFFRIVDHPLHDAFHGARAVAFDQVEHALARRRVAGHLGAKIERHEIRLARRTQVHRFDVLADLEVLDDLQRRQQDAFLERGFRGRTETAGRNAADIVLVQAVRDPAEQLAFPEHGAQQHHVLLVRGAHPGIVRDEHIAFVDTGVVAAVLERPFHLRIRDAGHVLHVRSEIHELRVFGKDGRVQVERVHGHGRARDALDRRAVFLVDLPQVVAHDFVGDGIDIRIPVAVQLQFVRDLQYRGRDIGLVDSIEIDVGHFADSWHGGFPRDSASRRRSDQ